MGRSLIGWWTKKGKGAKVSHLWAVGLKDPGSEVTICGKVGDREEPESPAGTHKRCDRCAERALRKGLAA